MSLFAKRLLQHLLLPSFVPVRVLLLELSTTPTPFLPHHLSTPPFPFVSSIHRLRSTTSTQFQAPSPNTHFAVFDYLVQSCGLSSDDALKVSKSIHHLKSPDKPDAVLCFLRDTGVREEDITAAISRHAHILLSNVEKSLKPSVAKLRKLGFDIEDISAIISQCPAIFRTNIARKVDFWMEILGSTEYLVVVLKMASLINSSLEKVLIPNLSFLKDQCAFSPPKILRLIKSNPRLITVKPEVLKKQAERAQELGVARCSGTFVYALILVSYLKENIINARLNNLINLGLSQEEVTTIVGKIPLVLNMTEERIGRKLEFLVNELGGDILELVRNPCLLTYSLDMRIIPRNLVRKLLKSKGISLGDLAFTSFMRPSNEKFLGKFIVPYENAIPGLRQAYLEAIARGASAYE